MNLLKKIEDEIYFGKISREDVEKAVFKAEESLKKDLREKCKHNYVPQEGGIYYEVCSKCGKINN